MESLLVKDKSFAGENFFLVCKLIYIYSLKQNFCFYYYIICISLKSLLLHYLLFLADVLIFLAFLGLLHQQLYVVISPVYASELCAQYD